MAKRSQLQQAIDAAKAEIAVLQAFIMRLENQRGAGVPRKVLKSRGQLQHGPRYTMPEPRQPLTTSSPILTEDLT